MNESHDAHVKLPRIADVAKEAGVSTATVSYVLAGKPIVTPSTRDHVLEVVHRMGYRRNRHARALRRGAAPMISVVVPDVTNPFYAELLAAIEGAALEQGWVVSLMNYQLDHQREIDYLERVLEEVPDGVIYFPMRSDALEQLAHRLATAPPFVLVEGESKLFHFSSVNVDNDEGARLAARHFHARGRRRVVFAGPPRAHPSAKVRSAAFAEEAALLGLEIPHTIFGETKTEDSAEAVLDLIEKDRSIDGVFAGNDMLALHLYSELHRIGRAVPEDFSVCGFDGIKLSRMLPTHLTTICQPISRIGQQAVQLVTERTASSSHIVLPAELYVGGTS